MHVENFAADDFLPWHFRRQALKAALGDVEEAAARRSPKKKV
jgi:hypothetical protein